MKKVLVILLVAMLTLAVSGAALAQQTSVPTATATLRDQKGTVVGTATFTDAGEAGVHVVVKLNGNLKAPGAHGIHIHDVGSCSPTFEAAGEHFNPIGKQHPNHAGDLPNILIQANGTTDYNVWSTRFTLKAGGLSLFDANGSSLIIHSNADDMVSKPSGNSDGRIACGVITGLNGLGNNGNQNNMTGNTGTGNTNNTGNTSNTNGNASGNSGQGNTGNNNSNNTGTSGNTGTSSTGTLTSTNGVTGTMGAPNTLPVTGGETDASLFIAILTLGVALVAGGYMLRRSASQM